MTFRYFIACTAQLCAPTRKNVLNPTNSHWIRERFLRQTIRSFQCLTMVYFGNNWVHSTPMKWWRSIEKNNILFKCNRIIFGSIWIKSMRGSIFAFWISLCSLLFRKRFFFVEHVKLLVLVLDVCVIVCSPWSLSLESYSNVNFSR